MFGIKSKLGINEMYSECEREVYMSVFNCFVQYVRWVKGWFAKVLKIANLHI